MGQVAPSPVVFLGLCVPAENRTDTLRAWRGGFRNPWYATGVSNQGIDFSKAPQVVAEYERELSREDVIPTKIGCRSWVEFCLERNGVIHDVRALRFSESHAIWYACLIKTGAVRRISRMEKRLRLNVWGRSTEGTIRRMLKGNLRDTIAAVYLRGFLEPHPALALWERMFREAEAEDRIENPSYWVERSVFLDRCTREGISVPQRLPDVLEWEEKIGLREFVRKTIDAHLKRTGNSRDPMTAGALRLEKHMLRAGLF